MHHFMVTFTLPDCFRHLARAHQKFFTPSCSDAESHVRLKPMLAVVIAPFALYSEEVYYSSCNLVIVGWIDVMPCSLQCMDSCSPNVRSHVLGLRERYDFVFRGVNHKRWDNDVRKFLAHVHKDSFEKSGQCLTSDTLAEEPKQRVKIGPRNRRNL
jgi:hypothetical protein